MNELRDEFLARAAFAADQHRGVGARHLSSQIQRLLEGGRLAQQRDAVAGVRILKTRAAAHRRPPRHTTLAAFRARFARHQHGVRGTPDENLQVARGERLGQVIPGTGAQRLDAGRDRWIARHHHEDRLLVGLEGGLQDVHPRHRLQVQIAEHDIEPATLDELEGFLRPARHGHVVAIALQDAGAPFAQGAIVVDDQQPERRARFGSHRHRIARRRIGCSLV